LGELGYPTIQVDSYFVVYAPSNLPASAVRRLNAELNRSLERPEIKARFADLGAAVLTISPDGSKRLIQEEQRTFAEVLKTAGIKAD
jgi:tripartite-type tricarboxylate transporter receptor subunit TctC